MALRSPGSPLAIAYEVRRAVAESPLQWILHETSARDPLVFGTVALVLGAVGLPAGPMPARRVIRVDPVLTPAAE